MSYFLKSIILTIAFTGFSYAIDGNSRNKIQKIVPAYRNNYQASNTFKTTGGFKSNFAKKSRSGNVFPKSQIPRQINSKLKGSSFEVQSIFKQNKNIGFSPNAVKKGGANQEFYRKSSKSVNPNDVPKSFKKLFKDKNY